MEVILLERMANLGQMGDVVTVRPGYARNFLLPQKKALRATKANQEYFAKQKAQLEATNLTRRKDAEAVAAKMQNLSVVVIRQAGETGMLYGSVSGRDIADAATAKGFTVDRRQVFINVPIKNLGLFPVDVHLHPEVAVKLTVNVARTEEEAVIQAEKGTAVILTPGGEGAENASTASVESAPSESMVEAPSEKPAKKARRQKKEAATEE